MYVCMRDKIVTHMQPVNFMLSFDQTVGKIPFQKPIMTFHDTLSLVRCWWTERPLCWLAVTLSPTTTTTATTTTTTTTTTTATATATAPAPAPAAAAAAAKYE